MAEEDIYMYTTKILAKIISKIEDMEKVIAQLTESINNLRKTQTELIGLLGEGFEYVTQQLQENNKQLTENYEHMFDSTISRLESLSQNPPGKNEYQRLARCLSQFTSDLNKILLMYRLMAMFDELTKKIEEAKTTMSATVTTSGGEEK